MNLISVSFIFVGLLIKALLIYSPLADSQCTKPKHKHKPLEEHIPQSLLTNVCQQAIQHIGNHFWKN